MNSAKKLLFSTLAVATILTLMFTYVPISQSAETTNQEKALQFLSDVIGLDMTRYSAKVISQTESPADSWGVVTTTLLYNMSSEESTISAGFGLRNNAISCYINIVKGSRILAQPAANALEAVKNTLDRYQSFSKASYVQPMRYMLNSMDKLENMTITEGDMKLTVKRSSIEDYVYVEWMKTVNGIENIYDRVILNILNGTCIGFADGGDLYKVGSGDVKVSREEAIRVAKEHAKNYSYMIGETRVSGFTILDEPLFADLSMQPRDGYTLYPHWRIRLCLDKVYFGGVTEIRVSIWADTGEIVSIQTKSTGGGPAGELPDDSSSAVPSSAAQTQNENLPPVTTYVAIAVAAIVILMSIAAFVLKKRRGK